MFVAIIPNRNSKPTILLRESYREGGKVKTRTIANLTKWPPERIAAMERLCKGEFDGWDGGEATSGEISSESHFSRYPKWGPIRFRERKISDYHAFGGPRSSCVRHGSIRRFASIAPWLPQ